jgi:hypothetical protein
MRIGAILSAFVGKRRQRREVDGGVENPAWQSERMPRTPRVLRWAWASAVTAGILMALSSGQSVSREEVLQLLKAVTALVEEEGPARAKDQPSIPPLDGPPIYIPDPKWGR